MGSYLVWMMRYSEALRRMLEGKDDVSDMCYDDLLKVLERPEVSKEHEGLAEFLEGLGHSKLSLNEKAKQLESNFYKYFNVAA